MAIKTIDILNVMVFQRQRRLNNGDSKNVELKAGDWIGDGFHLDFCDGINVLMGENGVGKTTILKMIYGATQWSFEKTNPGKAKKLVQFFSNNLSDMEFMKNAARDKDYCYFKVGDGEHYFEESLSHKGTFNFDQWLGLNIPSVFIPTTEMLSHSKGFLAMNEKYSMPFDGTQVDIIVNASLPETKEIPKSMLGVLDKISQAIGGKVIVQDDIFYVEKKDRRKVEFSLEAEGLRKLGLLWKLIRNGLLEKGSVLLWDEPEANLNPELYALVVDILLELEKNGVQIFVATHSYNFAKYLEIRRTEQDQVRFINLYKGTVAVNEKFVENKYTINEDDAVEIYSETADRLEDLAHNPIIAADVKLLNEVYAE